MWIQKQIYCVLWKISSLSICTLSYLILSEAYALDTVSVSADSQCECAHHRIVRTDPFGDKHILIYIPNSFLLSSFDCEHGPEPVPQTYAYLYGIINLIKIKKKSITKHQIMHSEQNQFSAWHIFLSSVPSLFSPALTVGYYSWINKRFVVVALCVSIVCSAETCEFAFLIFFFFLSSFFLLHLFMHCRASQYLSTEYRHSENVRRWYKLYDEFQVKHKSNEKNSFAEGTPECQFRARGNNTGVHIQMTQHNGKNRRKYEISTSSPSSGIATEICDKLLPSTIVSNIQHCRERIEWTLVCMFSSYISCELCCELQNVTRKKTKYSLGRSGKIGECRTLLVTHYLFALSLCAALHWPNRCRENKNTI